MKTWKDFLPDETALKQMAVGAGYTLTLFAPLLFVGSFYIHQVVVEHDQRVADAVVKELTKQLQQYTCTKKE